MNDFLARLGSMKSTVMAVVTALLTIAVTVGFISAENSADGILAISNLYEGIIALGGAVVSIILLLTKDKDPVVPE